MFRFCGCRIVISLFWRHEQTHGITACHQGDSGLSLDIQQKLCRTLELLSDGNKLTFKDKQKLQLCVFQRHHVRIRHHALIVWLVHVLVYDTKSEKVQAVSVKTMSPQLSFNVKQLLSITNSKSYVDLQNKCPPKCHCCPATDWMKSFIL